MTLVGYTIIASKTIDRWYDDDEKMIIFLMDVVTGG